MPKRIEMEWPDIGITVNATLLEEEEPELCDKLWKKLETPLKTFCRHCFSTGPMVMAWGRPSKNPELKGEQRAPLGRKKWLLSRLDPGTVSYDGASEIVFVYGPLTEPLESEGPVVGKFHDEDMNDLVRAGRAVWNAQYMTHQLMIMIVRRKE